MVGVAEGHHIALVEDGALPPGRDFAFVEVDGETWLAINRERLEEDAEPVLEDAWATYRLMRLSMAY